MKDPITWATELLALRRVMVRVEVPPTEIVDGLKLLPTVIPVFAGGTTVRVEMAGVVLFPLLVCRAPAGNVLMKLPPMAPVTFTVTVQEPFAGMDPPIRVTLDTSTVTEPPQVLLLPPEVNRPLGKVSVSGAVRVAMLLLGLIKVIVRVEVPPEGMVTGEKVLLTNGAEGVAGMTVKVAAAGAVLFPLLVCNDPIASELMKFPPLDPVTFIVTVQEPLAGMDPPVRVTLEAFEVTTPPQVLAPVPEVETLAGKVSVNGALRVATVLLGLTSVMVRVEVPPALIIAGEKALLRVGGAGVTGVMAQEDGVMRLESRVTAPFRARALPEIVAFVVRLMLVSARMFPINEVLVPRVAELPTCQNTLQF